MDRRVDVRHFVHRRSCDISSSNMAAYERWPRVNGRGTKYSSEVCRMTRVAAMCPCENGDTQQVTYPVLGCSFKYGDRRRITVLIILP